MTTPKDALTNRRADGLLMDATDAFAEALDGFTWETRDVGEHDWHGVARTAACSHCKVGFGSWMDRRTPCPVKQERRLVSPWETAPES